MGLVAYHSFTSVLNSWKASTAMLISSSWAEYSSSCDMASQAAHWWHARRYWTIMALATYISCDGFTQWPDTGRRHGSWPWRCLLTS